jgi:acyl-CoA synthetase (AMP-forming)/AMP-acid ligase II
MLYTNYFIDQVRALEPDTVLLLENSKSITAADLLVSSQRLAQALMESGVKSGDRVVLAVKPGVEFLQIIYANMMIRTVMSIIDPEMGRDNYKAKFNQFNPQHAFVDSRLILLRGHPIARFLALQLNKTIPDFPKLNKVKLFTTGPWLPIVQSHTAVRTLLKRDFKSVDFAEANAADDFLVTYTSGTLAEPKGVVHSYASLSNSIRYLSDMLKQHGDQAIATHLPQFALVGISAGVKVFMWDNTWSAEKKLEFIAANNITTLFGPPSDYLPLVQHLKKNNSRFPDALKNIYLGSAPVYSAFLKKLLACCDHIRVTSLYGMTENLMVAYQDARQKVSEILEGDLVGAPFPNVTLSIQTDGEICLQSDQLFSRYWHTEKNTAPHHTGDLGKLDEQGRLILQGRKKDMIIRRNFNVYPGLYEPTINKIDGIIEAVMIGVYNKEKADEEIILVIESEQKMQADYVNAKLRSGQYSIDREALPDKIVLMKLPRSGRQNKVNRQLLAKQLESLSV